MPPGRDELFLVAAIRREAGLAVGELAVGMQFGDVEQPVPSQNPPSLGENRGEVFDTAFTAVSSTSMRWIQLSPKSST